MADPKDVAGWATVALGASQALTPQTAAKVFGLDPLDEQAVWLARLLGVANLGLGAMALDPEIRDRAQTVTLTALAGNAAVTVLAAARGRISKRTAVMVLAFVGAVAAADSRD